MNIFKYYNTLNINYENLIVNCKYVFLSILLM